MAEASAPTSRELRGFQRRYLRGQAHPLRPLVQVGGAGINAAVLRAVNEALASHELVKIRLNDPTDKKAMAKELARGCGAALCGLVGHTVILYRPDPDEPRLVLPVRE